MGQVDFSATCMKEVLSEILVISIPAINGQNDCDCEGSLLMIHQPLFRMNLCSLFHPGLAEISVPDGCQEVVGHTQICSLLVGQYLRGCRIILHL